MEEKEAVQKLVAMMIAGKDISEDEINTLEAILLNASSNLKGDLKSDFYETLKDRISATGSSLFVGNTVNVEGIKEIADKTAKEVVLIQKREEAAKPENYIEQSMARAREEALREYQNEQFTQRIEEINKYFDDNREIIISENKEKYSKYMEMLGINVVPEIVKEESAENLLTVDKLVLIMKECQKRGMKPEDAKLYAMNKLGITQEDIDSPELQSVILSMVATKVKDIVNDKDNDGEKKDQEQDDQSVVQTARELEESGDATYYLLSTGNRAMFSTSKGLADLIKELFDFETRRIEGLKTGTRADVNNIIYNKEALNQNAIEINEIRKKYSVGLTENQVLRLYRNKENLENEISVFQKNIRGRRELCDDQELFEIASKNNARKDKILDYAMEKFFSTGMSLAHIYDEIKKKNPDEEIYFKDLFNKLSEELNKNAKDCGINSETIDGILRNEDNIRKKTVELNAVECYKNSLDYETRRKDFDKANEKYLQLKSDIIKNEQSGTLLIKQRLANKMGYTFNSDINDDKKLSDFEQWMNAHEKKENQEINPEDLFNKFGEEDMYVEGETKDSQKFGDFINLKRRPIECLTSLKSLIVRKKITDRSVIDRLKAIKIGKEKLTTIAKGTVGKVKETAGKMKKSTATVLKDESSGMTISGKEQEVDDDQR